MRGSIRKRGATWAITVRAGTDPITGQPLRIYRAARTEEAERELTTILRGLDTGTFADPGRLTLAEYLQGQWLPHIATRVRPRTALRYRQLLELHVIPKIGAVKLAKLRPSHVQSVVDAMVAKGRAPRTTAGGYRTLHAALKQAVRWQLLSVNPSEAIRPPRPTRPRPAVPDVETVSQLLAAAFGTRLYLPLVLAATTGMRRGELLALTWLSVDLEAGFARVTTSLQGVDGEFRFMDPKTDRARRTIALPPATVTLLRAHRKEQAERCLLLGEAWVGNGLVLERGDGMPLSPDAVSRAFYRLARNMGRPGLRLHDLRHAYATTLLLAGVHPKTASEALGHSSVGFTMDVYSHVLPSMQEVAGQAIEAALGDAIRPA